MKNGSEPFYIELLSWRNLRSALNLLNRVFPREAQAGERPVVFFTASLCSVGRFLLKWKGYPFVRYWVARDNETGAVIGTVGLYTKADDDEAYWGGWMCVDPEARGKSLGMMLAYRALVEAIKMGDRKYVRLYTSTDPNEAAAQIMYDQMGLQVYRVEDESGTGYKRLYRQIEL
ncbi:MAG: GNAT family N-acetyltransferase [Smithellaceae bacterium]|nr:GNAT family N-acetyltransferase [Smithellaceae bacterium]